VDFSYTGDDLTVDLCASLCDGYNFMGVEFGRECYCGNTGTTQVDWCDVLTVHVLIDSIAVQSGSVPVSSQSDLTCSNPLYACSGNSLQLCGGARYE
jgi:hypothetical protein